MHFAHNIEAAAIRRRCGPSQAAAARPCPVVYGPEMWLLPCGRDSVLPDSVHRRVAGRRNCSISRRMLRDLETMARSLADLTRDVVADYVSACCFVLFQIDSVFVLQSEFYSFSPNSPKPPVYNNSGGMSIGTDFRHAAYYQIVAIIYTVSCSLTCDDYQFVLKLLIVFHLVQLSDRVFQWLFTLLLKQRLLTCSLAFDLNSFFWMLSAIAVVKLEIIFTIDIVISIKYLEFFN